ncbi:Histone-lysine N-methyltransferase set9 [Thoreauomyces humboldtii]|nr:Histone-lysine N-methyltransferase set9 [Thoreauomyces humboldtii]
MSRKTALPRPYRTGRVHSEQGSDTDDDEPLQLPLARPSTTFASPKSIGPSLRRAAKFRAMSTEKRTSRSATTPGSTFQAFSDYDDILCDILLDSLYLGFTTHKMNGGYFESVAADAEPFGGCQSESGTKRTSLERAWKLRHDRIDRSSVAAVVVKLIRDHLMGGNGVNDAVAALVDYLRDPKCITEVPTGTSLSKTRKSFAEFQSFLQGRTPTELEDFKAHAGRYFSMYHWRSGYEVAPTSRYKSSGKVEACLIATKSFRCGDEIRQCEGVIIQLTEEDEELLNDRDFSVMYSDKKKANCLFLGPARFANHDCSPVCRFFPYDREGNHVCFKVIKDIDYGQELTTSYGDHYFGENNCECLCATCERLQKGGFAVANPMVALLGDEDLEQPMRARLRRSQTRVAAWDYYANVFAGSELVDVCNAGNASTSDVAPVRVTACSICQEAVDCVVSEPEQADESRSRGMASKGIQCGRCERHKKIFGFDWPNRKPSGFRAASVQIRGSLPLQCPSLPRQTTPSVSAREADALRSSNDSDDSDELDLEDFSGRDLSKFAPSGSLSAPKPSMADKMKPLRRKSAITNNKARSKSQDSLQDNPTPTPSKTAPARRRLSRARQTPIDYRDSSASEDQISEPPASRKPSRRKSKGTPRAGSLSTLESANTASSGSEQESRVPLKQSVTVCTLKSKVNNRGSNIATPQPVAGDPLITTEISQIPDPATLGSHAESPSSVEAEAVTETPAEHAKRQRRELAREQNQDATQRQQGTRSGGFTPEDAPGRTVPDST